ncbi:OLC1v1019099C1 [Oldenlandia corymbosa var. corymbosa]|uniref:OLC1v1019099C1 n=1 Tax=Oldenlandia corymbosa var. corymbosa TaxID=529605 RepID=A0AAV1ED92_OLDCO|nr:OLC1v1019099C1 [Oldenlandia corymbosa var. corymbosa]
MASSSAPPRESWFTPVRLLVVFCVINLINYVDRGAIASNGVNGNPKTCTKGGKCSGGSGIQGDFNLTNFQDGVISSAFMVGFLVASPIFAYLAKKFNPFRLIGVGLTVWTIAITGCGFAIDFWSLAICRMLVGVGEASFVSLAAPYIDDNAPSRKKTAWLGVFYMCIPCGVALGYVYGGLVANHLSWRYAFWIEAGMMVPFAILGFVMTPLQLKGFVQTESTPAASEGQRENFLRDVKNILVDKVYVVNVIGYTVYNFVIGAYSYWGPKAGYNIYHMKNADIIFGGVTCICGVFGTLAGGFVLDRLSSTIRNSFKLLSVATLCGGMFCFAAFCFKSLYAFIALFAIGELLLFATQGPVNFVCLHCVNPSLRPLSMALSTVSIHVFGDVPSSPLVGVLQDHIKNWRATALILTSILFLAALVWCFGIFLHSVDRFNEGIEPEIAPSDRSNTAPSLEDKPIETNNQSLC